MSLLVIEIGNDVVLPGFAKDSRSVGIIMFEERLEEDHYVFVIAIKEAAWNVLFVYVDVVGGCDICFGNLINSVVKDIKEIGFVAALCTIEMIRRLHEQVLCFLAVDWQITFFHLFGLEV